MSGSESWSRLSEELIAGIHHALNNRMATLSAVGQVLESELPADHPLAGALGTEVTRLESTTSMLRLLERGGGGEPVQLSASLADVSALLALHHRLRDVELVADVPAELHPLWVDPIALVRALLLMAVQAAGEGAHRVEVVARGDDEVVEVRITAGGEAAAGAEAGLADAGAMLGAWGGRVVEEGGALIATLPTLAAVRRREGR